MNLKWKNHPVYNSHCSFSELDISYRADIFFRIWVIRNNKWDVFKNWVISRKAKSFKPLDEEVRFKSILNSIRDNGYVHSFKCIRDCPIMCYKRDGRYHLINAATRISSMVSCGILDFDIGVLDFSKSKDETVIKNHIELLSRRFNFCNGNQMLFIDNSLKGEIKKIYDEFFSGI